MALIRFKRERGAPAGERPDIRIASHQALAAASPHTSIHELAANALAGDAAASMGNFKDLDMLIEQLGVPPVFQLGLPLPNERYLPGKAVLSCPAAHNRALLGAFDGGGARRPDRDELQQG